LNVYPAKLLISLLIWCQTKQPAGVLPTINKLLLTHLSPHLDLTLYKNANNALVHHKPT